MDTVSKGGRYERFGRNLICFLGVFIGCKYCSVICVSINRVVAGKHAHRVS